MSTSPNSPFLLFDFRDERGTRRRIAFKEPSDVLVAREIEEVRPALRAAQRASDAGMYVAGYVSYEAAPAFDAALSVHAGATMPLLWLGVFSQPTRRQPTREAPPTEDTRFHLSEWRQTIDRSTYDRNVATARELIARGQSYQINYTTRLRAVFEGQAFALYERLSKIQRADYHAYLDTGRHKVLSLSPELFFRWRGDRIETKPMKGTVERGRWMEEDEAKASWLAGSEKNRAENIMIVDLLRNDLGRIAVKGSVRVSSLFNIERYPTVFQMTSGVEARVQTGTTLEDIFAALFPCGSITGAPKVSTMRIISTLEDSPRNVYCGAVGFVSPRAGAVFNVAIRTIVIDEETGRAEYGTGGGITWDSTAQGEYEELLTKAAILSSGVDEFALLETMRLEKGEYLLLAEHLQRLAESARYFDFQTSAEAVEKSLTAYARAHPDEARRVRLTVSRQGDVKIESEPLRPLPAQSLPVALAAQPVFRRERFLYHKTTHRTFYERRRRDFPTFFDVLLYNEEGELTEFTNGNLVVELEGKRWTPPRECGLLAGTFRARLIKNGEVSTRVLTRDDLRRASKVWLVNSVRGWVTVSVDWNASPAI